MTRFYHIFAFVIIAAFMHSSLWTQQLTTSSDSSMFQVGFDIPFNIHHGTWDFDEWPGIDHDVIYLSDFMNNRDPNDKFKIDYFHSRFDSNDHEGYLKSQNELIKHGFQNITSLLGEDTHNKKLLGIFTHPDDELLLAGGLMAQAKKFGWDVIAYLTSNGSDGSEGESDEPSTQLGGYNAFGIKPGFQIKIVTDKKGENNISVVKKYSEILGIDVHIITTDLIVGDKRIVQFGDASGTNPVLTFFNNSPFKSYLKKSIIDIIRKEKPRIIITHGTDGEYGNFYHQVVHDIIVEVVSEINKEDEIVLLSGFPEYNFHDHITHFLDLYEDNFSAWNKKYEALKAIPSLYFPGADFDKPWYPTDSLKNRVFMKDYGFTPIAGEPPRYEYFSRYTFMKSQ